MAYNYSTTITENSAKAAGIALAISKKESIVVCNAIRGMNAQKAKKFLEDVIALKRPVPYTVYNKNIGHKPGMATGRYPVNVCEQVLKLLKSAEANAQFKGLSTANLTIRHASAQKGPTVMHYGRKRAKAKRAHVELVLEEVKK